MKSVDFGLYTTNHTMIIKKKALSLREFERGVRGERGSAGDS
jgi:hypothetical protein